VHDTGVDNVGTVPAAVATFLTWVNDIIIHLYTHTSVVLLMTMLSALHHPLL
jgi:hypothetical protein